MCKSCRSWVPTINPISPTLDVYGAGEQSRPATTISRVNIEVGIGIGIGVGVGIGLHDI